MVLNNSSSLLRVYVESDELNKDERFFLDLLASYDLAFRERCILKEVKNSNISRKKNEENSKLKNSNLKFAGAGVLFNHR